jgi:hypothetical protein
MSSTAQRAACKMLERWRGRPQSVILACANRVVIATPERGFMVACALFRGKHMLSRLLRHSLAASVFLSVELWGLVARAADEASGKPNAAALAEKCRLDVENETASLERCQAACYSALETVSHQAHSFYSQASLALWITIGIVAVLLGGALFALHRAGVKAGWPASKLILARVGATVVALLVGIGIHIGLFNALAERDLRAVYDSACEFKVAGVAESTRNDVTGLLVCNPRDFMSIPWKSGDHAFASFRRFEGIYVTASFPELPDVQPSTQMQVERMDDMTAFLIDAAKLDKDTDCRVRNNVNGGPYGSLMDHVPFPGSYVIAAALAAVLGWVLALLARLLTR